MTEIIDWKAEDRCVRQHSEKCWFTGSVVEVNETNLGIIWDYSETKKITFWPKDKVQRPTNY